MDDYKLLEFLNSNEPSEQTVDLTFDWSAAMVSSGIDVSDQFLSSMQESFMPVPEQEQLQEYDCSAEQRYRYQGQTPGTSTLLDFSGIMFIPTASDQDLAEAESIQQAIIVDVNTEQANDASLFTESPTTSTNTAGITPNVTVNDAVDIPYELPLNLKHGTAAWSRWAKMENAKATSYNGKAWPEDFLQLDPATLCHGLCGFITQVRRVDGGYFPPETIYYLVTGIQQCVLNSGRPEYFWSDRRYEPFVECFDQLAQRFKGEANVPRYFTIRVKEENLWSNGQLGNHSPIDLLTTLIYFNTIYFRLHTAEQHFSLQSYQLWKAWEHSSKRGARQHELIGSLRYTVPETPVKDFDFDAVGNKRTHYDQFENKTHPERCPLRLHELYLSKCPRRGKDEHNDYYLEPERTYTASSPIWFSKQSLSVALFNRIFNRLKMVLEVERAIFNAQSVRV
ncbi:glutamine-rich protein 1-like [Anopheles stephensi]|uniref:glutamine-rich protein 1-like n=1 Tax=Anopheles stephensi TaxID=30069 RepID=UPI001658A799|nr:glutamine-rich protein 1-like [Anopheles stephensi]